MIRTFVRLVTIGILPETRKKLNINYSQDHNIIPLREQQIY